MYFLCKTECGSYDSCVECELGNLEAKMKAEMSAVFFVIHSFL